MGDPPSEVTVFFENDTGNGSVNRKRKRVEIPASVTGACLQARELFDVTPSHAGGGGGMSLWVTDEELGARVMVDTDVELNEYMKDGVIIRVKHHTTAIGILDMPNCIISGIIGRSYTGIKCVTEQQHRIGSLALVCKQFKEVIMPPSSLHLTANGLLPRSSVDLSLQHKLGILVDTLYRTCGGAEGLTNTLTVMFDQPHSGGWIPGKEGIVRTYKKLPALRHLGVRDLTIASDFLITKVPLAYPRVILASCPNLTSLTLRNMSKLSPHFYKWAGEACPHIRTLAISHCCVFTAHHMDAQGNCLSNWNALRELDLRGINVNIRAAATNDWTDEMFLCKLKTKLNRLTMQWSTSQIDASLPNIPSGYMDVVNGLGKFVEAAPNLVLLRAPLVNPAAFALVSSAARATTMTETTF